jgi:hypothetical protein
MNTRKYPRTMQEAFGPYTSHRIDDVERPFDHQDSIVMVACAIAVALLALMAIGGVL